MQTKIVMMVLILTTRPIFQQLCKASVRACPGHRFLKVTADARQGQGLPSPLAVLSIIFWMPLQFQNKLGPSWTNTIQRKCKVPGKDKVCLPPGCPIMLPIHVFIWNNSSGLIESIDWRLMTKHTEEKHKRFRFLLNGRRGHWSSLNIHSYEHKGRLSLCFLLNQQT